MRFFPATLALTLAIAGALRATEFPTLRAQLPDVTTAQGSSVPAIDLRNHFEVTDIVGQVVQFRTSLGTFNAQILAGAGPATVPNFLAYVNAGAYTNSFIHRSIVGLGIIQGGGFNITTFSPLALGVIPTNAPIPLEYTLPNTRGTLAMARTDQPDSATSGWFINTIDNTNTFGPGNAGGYAVFARVTGSGMTVVDAIQAVPVYNGGGALANWPLVGFTGGSPVAANLVVIQAVEAVPIFPESAGQNAVVTFSVTNSDPALVTATVSGSILNLVLAPDESGFSDVVVTATDSNGNPVQSAFRVNVTPPPDIAVEQPVGNALADGGTRSVGLVNVGAAAELSFTIRNPGAGRLRLTGTPKVVLDGANAGEFSVTTEPVSPIAASGGTTTFTVRFAPTSGGAKTAAVHLATNDADEALFDIALTGAGNAVPSLSLPTSPVIAEATSPGGAVVTFNVTANDAEDGVLAPNAMPTSGSTFVLGDTTVNVSATDANGAQTAGSFTVRVRDTTAPALTLPADQVAEATGASGAVLNYPAATATDAVGVTSLTYSKDSGTTFPLGVTTVTVTARDAANNTTAQAFTVRVRDTTPPALTLPANQAVEATGASGAVVNYPAATATDAVGVTSLTYSKDSGTNFPLGVTAVTVTARDAANNTATQTFTVTVAFLRPATTEVNVGAQSGDPATGGPTGALLHTFGPPAVSDTRDLAARVTMRADGKTLGGIYVEDLSGAGSVVAFQGGPVPGIAAAGVTFRSFLDPVIASDASIAFAGRVQGGGVKAGEDSGVWTDVFGAALELALREGNQVPGLPVGARLKAVTSLSVRTGELLALVTLSAAKGVVAAGDDTVLLRMSGPTAATALLREGKELAGLAGSKIKSFSVLSPALGSPGHGRWHADGVVVAKVILFDGRTLLVKIAPAGTVTPLLSSADAATPVAADARWKSFALPGVGSAGTGFVVAAILQSNAGNVTAANDAALLTSPDGTAWSVFAREGGAAPVTPAGPLYASFFDPVVNDAGHVAFLATLQGAGIKASNKTALFAGATNSPQLRARLGDPAPDATGAPTTAVWSKFISHALPSGAGAGVIFLAETTGGDSTAKNKLALWAVDSQGTVRRLLRTGDTLPARTSPLTALTLLNAAPGAYGTTRSFNATASIALAATFADKTQALLRVDVP